MPSRINPEPNPEDSDSDSQVNISKRYDVYCSEVHGGSLVVYRNVCFRRIRHLLPRRDLDFVSEVIELEQANGHTFFIKRFNLCERRRENGLKVAV